MCFKPILHHFAPLHSILNHTCLQYVPITYTFTHQALLSQSSILVFPTAQFHPATFSLSSYHHTTHLTPSFIISITSYPRTYIRHTSPCLYSHTPSHPYIHDRDPTSISSSYLTPHLWSWFAPSYSPVSIETVISNRDNPCAGDYRNPDGSSVPEDVEEE